MSGHYAKQFSIRISLAFFLLFSYLQPCHSVIQFFSAQDLKYTFGVNSLAQVPKYRELYPEVERHNDGRLKTLVFELDDRKRRLHFESVTNELIADRVTVVHRERVNGGGQLDFVEANTTDDCHFHHFSNHTFAAISTCDGSLKGTIIDKSGIHVLHPLPEHHQNRVKRSADGMGLHIVYKRDAIAPTDNDFCGLENTLTSEEILENESGVMEDVFVTGQRLVQDGQKLQVELAIFVDETLWRHFSSKYGGAAWQKLQQYAVTMLNNIQIMYKQPSAVPQLFFRIVRYEVFKTQPSAMAPHLHSHGHAQLYLDRFCRYQRSLGVRDWDHALLLTGYDIHRGSGSRSISGIARLDGMCDPSNTCTLAEGLDFTSAFISTHELGHSVGMRHDEPYCSSTFIMSSSLGPGKVTWSTCSLRDYHSFLQRLDSRGKNCLRTTLMPEKVQLTEYIKPGQIYDANLQCTLMHGPGYNQITPRVDHYDGICYMMWCGQSQFGRIVTSHPALEGTFCGPNKWCNLGRCVPWTGQALPPPPTLPPPTVATQPQIQPQTTTTLAPQTPTKNNGGWSAWTTPVCSQCDCQPIIGAIGITISRRTCSNPYPMNGGQECTGSTMRAVVCSRTCPQQTLSVNQFISNKCAEHKRIKQDPDLTGTGSQLTRYQARSCKVFCDVKNAGGQRNYRHYGENLPDGTPCGWDKFCLNGDCLELSCNRNHLLNRDLSCPSDSCPLNAAPVVSQQQGVYGVWSLWSSCSVSCGSGFRHRARTCSIPNKCQGPASEQTPCTEAACPVPQGNEPRWTEWTSWNGCSASCGVGSSARYRRCTTPQNTIAFNCVGQPMEIRSCEELPCPGQLTNSNPWSAWSAWSVCSTTCGPGTQTRTRSCPREPCDGSGNQRMACNVRECAGVQWSAWGTWSQCSANCNRGIRSRSRACPVLNACAGPAFEQENCNEQPCSTTNVGSWTQWSDWSLCSVSCGNGVKRRTRACNTGNCPGSNRETTTCSEAVCTVSNAQWGGWGSWSNCMSNQLRRRIRKCYGSGSCPGEEMESEKCA